MSWLSNNYEKLALGGAVVAAIGLGAITLKNKGDMADAFSDESPKRNQETDVSGLPEIIQVNSSFGELHEVIQPDIDGRKIDLFTGVPLFSKKDDQENPVDLLKSAPVHAEIDNNWWMKHGIDPGFSDSPERDPDKDGFTNREEFVAETDPNDFDSHPDPIVKLLVVPKEGVKTTQVHIKPSDYGGGQFVFRLENKRGARVNRMGPGAIRAGDTIEFLQPLMQKRFRFIKMIQKQVMKNGVMQPIKVWEIEDLKPNKNGEIYQVDRRGKPGIQDVTVEFILQALRQGGNPFKIEENIRFSLPFDANAKQKPYLLKKVDLENKTVDVEYVDQDGTTKLHMMSYQ
ncbi:MAG: hypothetical protein KJO21_08560 [Verrucomicrobiae bacterium]|nr:hypothetical protein [Verrucomicrobiae bacterium]NNJ43525.1 hypothetical protein [Akkermansiaceae bacterium]